MLNIPELAAISSALVIFTKVICTVNCTKPILNFFFEQTILSAVSVNLSYNSSFQVVLKANVDVR